jgi:hypothetical protein
MEQESSPPPKRARQRVSIDDAGLYKMRSEHLNLRRDERECFQWKLGHEECIQRILIA